MRGWRRSRPGAPVAVAIAKSAEGEFALDTVGLAWKRGEARAVPLQLIEHLKPLAGGCRAARKSPAT